MKCQENVSSKISNNDPLKTEDLEMNKLSVRHSISKNYPILNLKEKMEESFHEKENRNNLNSKSTSDNGELYEKLRIEQLKNKALLTEIKAMKGKLFDNNICKNSNF